MRLIECRGCDARNCEGCNLFELAEMLHKGKLDCLMDEHHSIVIDPESLRPKGRWGIYTDEDEVFGDIYYPKCTLCGKLAFSTTSYCPNCGAKMEG